MDTLIFCTRLASFNLLSACVEFLLQLLRIFYHFNNCSELVYTVDVPFVFSV